MGPEDDHGPRQLLALVGRCLQVRGPLLVRVRHLAVDGGQFGCHVGRGRRYKDEGFDGAMVVVLDGNLHEAVDEFLIAEQVVGVVRTTE